MKAVVGGGGITAGWRGGEGRTEGELAKDRRASGEVEGDKAVARSGRASPEAGTSQHEEPTVPSRHHPGFQRSLDRRNRGPGRGIRTGQKH